MKKLLVFLPVLLFACSQSHPGADVPLDRAREYANVLYNQELYWQAIDAYGKLLDTYSMNETTRANINYTVGDIYFSKVGDYSNALSFYLKVKYLYPESSLIDEVNKKVVACLERLGKSAAASSFLKESASLSSESDSPFEQQPGDTVAVVAGEVITTGDLDMLYTYYRNSLPQEEREKEPTREDRIAFLSDYVRSQVLYNSAKMQQLDQDPDVQRVAFLQKKQLMIQKLLEEEIGSTITVTDEEIAQWYEENKSRLTSSDPNRKTVPTLDEAKNDIRQLLIMRKSNKKQDDLTDKLVEAQNARLFPRNIK